MWCILLEDNQDSCKITPCCGARDYLGDKDTAQGVMITCPGQILSSGLLLPTDFTWLSR